MKNLLRPLFVTLPALLTYVAFSAGRSDLDYLKTLVEIPSESADAKGTQLVIKLAATRLSEAGLNHPAFIYPPHSKLAPLYVAEKAGSEKRFITLVAHADTVFDRKTGFLKMKVDGERAFGPGVIDDKGGLLVLMKAIEKFLSDSPKLRYSLRVVISPTEETGSTNFLDRFKKYGEDSDYVLGFEPALENGNVVSSRRGDRWYDISVEGTEAHAGRNHPRGANACDELAIKAAKLRELTDYDRGLSVNLGHIEGGEDKYSIVCGWAKAKLDLRFADPENRKRLIEKVEKILNTVYVKSREGSVPTKTTYRVVDDPMPFTAAGPSKKVADQYVEILNRIEGQKFAHEQSGGSADSNFFYRDGLVILDGLGPRGGNMHRQDEYLLVKSIESRAQAVAELLKWLNK